jgi:hypothetical protein
MSFFWGLGSRSTKNFLVDPFSLKKIEVDFALHLVSWVITIAVYTFRSRTLGFAELCTPWRMVAIELGVPKVLGT